jgi:hypothetical protein
MQWWMYVLIAAGLVVAFNVLLVLWLGIVARHTHEEPRHFVNENEH